MSIRQNFPTTQPSLVLDFANSKTLDPRITFTRSQTTSNGSTYTGPDGLIKYAGADEPRFDHRYESGYVKSLGLLIEESRSNLIIYSTISTVAGWSISGSTVTNNATTAPDGTNTAARIQATGDYVAALSISVTAGQTYTFSFWVKSVSGSGTWGINWYEGVTGHNRTTVNVTEEWERVSITFTPTQSQINVYVSDDRDNLATISDAYVWGAQLEQGSFKTSLIPTEGSTATRNPDNVSMVGENFLDWYNQSEGSILWIGNVYTREINAVCPYKITEGSNLRGIGVQFDTRSGLTNSFFISRAVASNIPSKTAPAGTIPSENKIKIAGSYEEGVGIGAAFNGSEPASSGGDDQTDIVFGTENQMDICGARSISGSNNKFSGVCEQLVYYPRRLTNAQLQNLTK